MSVPDVLYCTPADAKVASVLRAPTSSGMQARHCVEWKIESVVCANSFLPQKMMKKSDRYLLSFGTDCIVTSKDSVSGLPTIPLFRNDATEMELRVRVRDIQKQ